MRYLNLFLIALCIFLGSCHHSEEPPKEVNLHIAEQYRPAEVTFKTSDKDFADKAKEFDDKSFIVRSAEELPDDPIGFPELYRKINFRNYDLLLFYCVYRWDFDSYSNRFYRDRIENKYKWEIHLGVGEFPESESEIRHFNRFAIKVKKLPENADVEFWVSFSHLNWDWDN
ncbi:MAG: hypothetical protein K2M31_09615 [Muribaculaceae bacterium]|nr:hypothetical protein [Muribaculaceae bacterium]